MKNYTHLTTGEIFLHCRRTRGDSKDAQALAWVEAENIMRVREIIIDWFYALENGVAHYRRPNPANHIVSPKQANQMIEKIDDDFEHEFKKRSNALGIDYTPELSRLGEDQKLALAQEISCTKLNENDLERITWDRLKQGEKLPPNGWTMEIVANAKTHDNEISQQEVPQLQGEDASGRNRRQRAESLL